MHKVSCVPLVKIYYYFAKYVSLVYITFLLPFQLFQKGHLPPTHPATKSSNWRLPILLFLISPGQFYSWGSSLSAPSAASKQQKRIWLFLSFSLFFSTSHSVLEWLQSSCLFLWPLSAASELKQLWFKPLTHCLSQSAFRAHSDIIQSLKEQYSDRLREQK